VTRNTVEETAHNIRKAIELHLAGMAEDGAPIPEPRTLALEIEVPFVA
jgi:predicted RNase H-like HicB family nuclease